MRSDTCRAALLSAMAVLAAGCAAAGGGSQAPTATTAVEKLEYYPFQVKGYQYSYPHRTLLVLMPADARDHVGYGGGNSPPLNGDPAIGAVVDQSGTIVQRLYTQPLGPILQQAIIRSADEAGLTGATASETQYEPGHKRAQDYVLVAKVTKCWVKKSRGADGQYGAVWRTQADFALDVSVYKSPFSVPFWQGTTNDTYYDPPVGSFGLGPEDEAGIYDEPGQVLSVALTRAVAGIFQRQDLRNLMVEDDIRPR